MRDRKTAKSQVPTSVEIRVRSGSVCVPPAFIESRGPILRDGLPEWVELALFTPELRAMTGEQHAQLSGVYDKRKWPSDWVRITLYGSDTTLAGFQSAVQSAAENQPTGRDSGFIFRRHPRDPDYQDMYGHPAEPEFVMLCGPSRCWTPKQKVDGFWYTYDFPRAYVPNWHALHLAIQQRTKEWSSDKSCLR